MQTDKIRTFLRKLWIIPFLGIAIFLFNSGDIILQITSIFFVLYSIFYFSNKDLYKRFIELAITILFAGYAYNMNIIWLMCIIIVYIIHHVYTMFNDYVTIIDDENDTKTEI